MIVSAYQPYFAPRPPVYPQLWGRFIPNLSVFDLLFNCGPKGSSIINAGVRKNDEERD
ncbi:MAG: WbqC family protein [Deltaproteobacteria bacterium]|nr:WbqC family protein [Deltaproteobacteria bacterium]